MNDIKAESADGSITILVGVVINPCDCDNDWFPLQSDIVKKDIGTPTFTVAICNCITDSGITGGIYGWYGIYLRWLTTTNCDWIWAAILLAFVMVLLMLFPIIVLCSVWIISCCLANNNEPSFVRDSPYITEFIDAIEDTYWLVADIIGGQHGWINPGAL